MINTEGTNDCRRRRPPTSSRRSSCRYSSSTTSPARRIRYSGPRSFLSAGNRLTIGATRVQFHNNVAGRVRAVASASKQQSAAAAAAANATNGVHPTPPPPPTTSTTTTTNNNAASTVAVDEKKADVVMKQDDGEWVVACRGFLCNALMSCIRTLAMNTTSSNSRKRANESNDDASNVRPKLPSPVGIRNQHDCFVFCSTQMFLRRAATKRHIAATESTAFVATTAANDRKSCFFFIPRVRLDSLLID